MEMESSRWKNDVVVLRQIVLGALIFYDYSFSFKDPENEAG